MERTIHVYWKKGIDEAERDAAIDGVKTFVKTLRETPGHNMPNSNIEICGVNTALDMYVRALPKIGTLTDARAICECLGQMYRDSGSIDPGSIVFYLTDEPLSDGSYIVGLTRATPPCINIVVSTYHFRRRSSAERLASIKLCAMHELGHAHGMVGDRHRINSVYNCGNHCADPLCLMNQMAGNFAPLIRRHHDRWFCLLCLEDARITQKNYDIEEKRKRRTAPPDPTRAASDSTTELRSLPPRADRQTVSPPPLPPRRAQA